MSEERLSSILKKLESFETRSSLSSTNSTTRGIGAARQWILQEMKSYSPKLQVSFDSYHGAEAGPHHARRRAAQRDGAAARPEPAPHLRQRPLRHGRASRRPGRVERRRCAARSRRAHGRAGRSRTRRSTTSAPGVNDDGSGTALTIELARIFSQSGIDFDATLVFMCHVGEEQGLVGARLHAQKAVAEKIPIEAVLNNDIVGNDKGGNGIIDGATIRVYSEGPEDSPSRALARFVQRWGGRYVPSHKVRPMARPDRFGRGGDHSAYNQLGFTAVGFRESRENFTRQHDVRDTFEGISLPYLAQNARVNAAAAATLALAPPPPAVTNERGLPMISRAPTGYDAQPRMDRLAGRRRVSDFLARGVGTRLAARAARRQRHRPRPARTCRSTTTSSVSRLSTPLGTRASSAPTSRRRERRPRSRPFRKNNNRRERKARRAKISKHAEQGFLCRLSVLCG